jgi:hypothetical protein
MNIRNAFLFFACISFTTMSCDTRDPDPSANNLSEFAKEFVSMHVGSPNAMTSDGDVAFNQLIQNVLGVMMLWMVVWFVHNKEDKKATLFKSSERYKALSLAD